MPHSDEQERKKYAREWYLKNREAIHVKNMTDERKAHRAAYMKEYYANNSEAVRRKKREYKQRVAERNGRVYQTRQDIADIAAQKALRRAKGRLVRSFFKADNYAGMGRSAWNYHNVTKRNSRMMLESQFRVTIRKALRGENPAILERVLGYTASELRGHIASLLPDGMRWHDVLTPNVHIDHKIPRCAFVYSTKECKGFKDCWSLSNLQPLWAHDNRIKANSM